LAVPEHLLLDVQRAEWGVEDVTPDEAEKLQRKYVNRRRRWARAIGRPLVGYEAEPPPGELDAEDPENG
jgi:hypothetical protein